METINRIGLRIVIITLVAFAVIGGGGWGAYHVITRNTAPKPIPSPALPSLTQLTDSLAKVKDFADKTGDTTVRSADDNSPLLAPPVNPGFNNTYTKKYFDTLPKNAVKSDVLSKDRLAAFIEASKGTLLPAISTSDIVTTADQGKDAIKKYLDSISSDTNASIQVVTSADIATGFQEFYANNKPDNLNAVITKLTNNLAALQKVPVPTELIDLHKKLVAASESLLNNTVLLKSMPIDFVGGLVGARNIEDLGSVFTDIGTQIQTIKDKYSL